VRRVALLGVALTLVAATGASAGSGRTLHGQGLTLPLPHGWHGLVGSAGVQVADFPIPQRARSSANLAQVSRGHVHLIITNGGPWVPDLHFPPASAPLALRMRDLLRGGLEGFGGDDTFARRDARIDGDMVDVVADLGPRPHVAAALRKANAVLATLRMLPSRVLHPRNRRLAADGVAVRLLPGWSGLIEIPPGRYAARLVLRAAKGGVHVTLLELPGPPTGGHLDLPVALMSRNVVRVAKPPVARRVFSNGGWSFDLSVTARSARDLRAANQLLATLTVEPRPWTFRSCSLTLRVPGTWRVAIRPRRGCYPVLELRGPHASVVVTELRPGEHASGRILRQAGRRFHVEVRPASARASANEVLATLRAEPRC
jgi:hypothetical protein